MVDEAAKMVDVKKRKKTVSYAIDDQTKITRAGKEISLADLKKGMHVSIEYNKEGDKTDCRDNQSIFTESCKEGQTRRKTCRIVNRLSYWTRRHTLRIECAFIVILRYFSL